MKKETAGPFDKTKKWWVKAFGMGIQIGFTIQAAAIADAITLAQSVAPTGYSVTDIDEVIR